MNVDPIGFFCGDAVRKYETPRQGVFAGGRGRVELLPGENFETALRDLDGFERIWLVFAFDRNAGVWRPTTRPPVAAAGRDRVGLFASRAPYRPNPIGISAVKLLSVKGLVLEVDEADLLDGTPILDVKPYVPAADAFPNARAGWVDDQTRDSWKVSFSPAFERVAAAVRAAGGPDLAATVALQLGHDPFDASRKRVVRTEAGGVLSLRMFRIPFSADEPARTVAVDAPYTGYTPDELASQDDPYADKAVHRAVFGTMTT